MKLLATIKGVRIQRQYKRQDGTFGNIFGVTLESGDDTIIAETFFTKEAQSKRGIVPGAIGTATVAMSIREWQDKDLNTRYNQDIRLTDFALANRAIHTDATPATEQADDSQAVTAMMAEAALEAEAHAAEANKEDLPY
jgi:hypothetical protein